MGWQGQATGRKLRRKGAPSLRCRRRAVGTKEWPGEDKERLHGQVAFEPIFVTRREVKAGWPLWALQTKPPALLWEPELLSHILLILFPKALPQRGQVEREAQVLSTHRKADTTLSWFGDFVPVLRFLCPPGSSQAEFAPHPQGCSFSNDISKAGRLGQSPQTSPQGEAVLPGL